MGTEPLPISIIMADTVLRPEEPENAGSVELKENTVIVVLGASGDLAKKKTFPALFGLYRNKFLPKDIKVVGYARTKMDHNEYLTNSAMQLVTNGTPRARQTSCRLTFFGLMVWVTQIIGREMHCILMMMSRES